MSSRIILGLVLSSLIFSCSSYKKGASTDTTKPGPDFLPVLTLQPGVLVYKTKKDYSALVPVVLSEDKSQIISYPHPRDISKDGRLMLPDKLEGGYLLDNRGIQKNVAFLKYTYEEYSRLKTAPSPTDLYKNILDKEPLVELCDCGDRNQYPNITYQLNLWIKAGTLRKICRPLL